VRAIIPPYNDDRPLAYDIAGAAALIRDGSVADILA
jgi:histidine ammonia-lyase